MLLFLGMTTAWACTVQLNDSAPREPAFSAPTFTWTTDCPNTRFQLRQFPDRGVLIESPILSTERSYAIDPAVWAGLPAGKYQWRVTSNDQDGAERRILWIDQDEDGDGVGALQGDCDDTRGDVFPGAAERCDGIDQDCNGIADDGASGAFSASQEWTTTLQAGTALAPAAISLVDEDLLFCGTDTYFATVTASGVSSLIGDAVLDGAGTTVVTVSPGADVLVDGLTLQHGDGGLRCTDATVSLQGVSVLDNTSATNGGGLLGVNCLIDVADSLFTGNSTSFGGGAMSIRDGSVLTFTGSIADGNTATVVGGGLEIYNSTATCDNSGILANTADYAGGVYLVGTNDFDMAFCDFGANAPEDIQSWDGLAEHSFAAGLVVSNTCTNGVCGQRQTFLNNGTSWRTFGEGVCSSGPVARTFHEFHLFARTTSPGGYCTVFLAVTSNSVTVAQTVPEAVTYGGNSISLYHEIPIDPYEPGVAISAFATCIIGGVEALDVGGLDTCTEMAPYTTVQTIL